VWQYTISGRGLLTLNSKSYDLLPGSMLLLTVPGPHIYCLPQDSPHWEFAFIVTIGREAIYQTRMLEKRIGSVIPPDLMKGKPRTLDTFYSFLEKLFSGTICDQFTNSAYTYGFCMTFMQEFENIMTKKEKQSHLEPYMEPYIELTNFLKKNIYRDIPVSEMADILGLSRSHFTRTFTSAMGMSPRLYLEDLRLKTATSLLSGEHADTHLTPHINTRVSIKEASERCGFYDANYFCRVFKKHFGISPGKYREMNI
jgi:AraC-like DNA-binding protein